MTRTRVSSVSAISHSAPAPALAACSTKPHNEWLLSSFGQKPDKGSHAGASSLVYLDRACLLSRRFVRRSDKEEPIIHLHGHLLPAETCRAIAYAFQTVSGSLTRAVQSGLYQQSFWTELPAQGSPQFGKDTALSPHLANR